MKDRPSVVGSKVLRWLARQRDDGRDPSTPTALARLVGCDQKTVEHWTKHGRTPGARWIPRLAEVMGVDPAWLVDPARRWPPEDDVAPLAVLAASLPRAEQAALAAVLADPAERAALLAADRARRAARAAAR